MPQIRLPEQVRAADHAVDNLRLARLLHLHHLRVGHVLPRASRRVARLRSRTGQESQRQNAEGDCNLQFHGHGPSFATVAHMQAA